MSRKVKTVPRRINSKRNTLRHILVKLGKIKDKEKILKAIREKQKITYKQITIRLSTDIFGRNSAGQKGLACYI